MKYEEIKTESEKYKELFSLPGDILTSIVCSRKDLPTKLKQAMSLLSDVKAELEIGSKECDMFDKVIIGSNVIPF